MANDVEIKLIATMYDRIFDILTYHPGGDKTAVFDKDTTFFQFIPNGIPIDPRSFENAITPANPNGSLSTSEVFSRMVDPIPAVQNQYSATSKSINTTYGTIVNGANCTELPDPTALDNYNKAYAYLYQNTSIKDYSGNIKTTITKTPIFSSYSANKLAYLTAISAYRTAYNSYDLNDLKQQREWQANAPLLQANVDNTWDAFRGEGASEVEEALEVMDTSINSAVHAVLEQARKTYSDSSLKSNMIGTPDWHLSYAMPDNWYDESAAENFTQIKFNTKSLNQTASSSFNSYGGGGSFSWGFWGSGGSVEHKDASNSSHMDATDLQISFKLGIIQIFRPWLDGSIFNMGGWNLGQAYKKGEISTGSLSDAGTKEVMPLIPVSFVVARDIQISGNWGSNDTTHIESSTSGTSSVGWGPFRVSGHYSHSSSQDTFNSKYQDGSITVPGIQIIGWLSQIVPQCPQE